MPQPPLILVTGAAGYIGSTLIHELHLRNLRIIALDHALPTPALKKIPGVLWSQGDYSDTHLLRHLCNAETPLAVIHLAASIEVGASVSNPAQYYDNNGARLISFLETIRTIGIPFIIAASSSAVYGDPVTVPITESHPLVPLSPYGRTKQLLEWLLTDYATAYGTRYAIARFSNVAGALPEQGLGELHLPETHLIPRALAAAVARIPFTLYGIDYPTPDGSCVRDFVHVRDIAMGLCALFDYLQSGGSSSIFNFGSGRPHSVLELMATIAQVVGQPTEIRHCPRRPGDPAALVLDITRAQECLGWQPVHSGLEKIVIDAYRFFCDQNQLTHVHDDQHAHQSPAELAPQRAPE